MPFISNYLWFREGELTPTQIAEYRMKCTVTGKLDRQTGELARAICWRQTAKLFGVPRVLSGATRIATLKVAHPRCDWPKRTLPYRHGQKDAVDALVTWFKRGKLGGRLSAKTGAGKTSLALTIAAKLGVPAIVLVHKADLMDSFAADAEKFFPGCRVGIVRGDTWDYKNKHVVVAMVQTLHSRKDTMPKDFTNSFGMVIGDEFHHCSAKIFESALAMFPARYRLGISATWRRTDGLEKVWDLHIGPIVHKATTKHVLGEYCTPIYKGDFGPLRRGASVAEAVTKLSKNEAYNEWLARQCFESAKQGRQVVLLSDRTEQLEKIVKLTRNLLDRGGYERRVDLLIGKVKADERREILAKSDVICATYAILSEGTNCPRLDMLLLATPRSDVEQAVGRIQRPHDLKKQPLVVDPVLLKCQYPAVHATQRRRIKQYQTLGFTFRKPVRKKKTLRKRRRVS